MSLVMHVHLSLVLQRNMAIVTLKQVCYGGCKPTVQVSEQLTDTLLMSILHVPHQLARCVCHPGIHSISFLDCLATNGMCSLPHGALNCRCVVWSWWRHRRWGHFGVLLQVLDHFLVHAVPIVSLNLLLGNEPGHLFGLLLSRPFVRLLQLCIQTLRLLESGTVLLLHLGGMLQNRVPASVLFVSCHAHCVISGIINVLLAVANRLLHLLELCVCKGIIEIKRDPIWQFDPVVFF